MNVRHEIITQFDPEPDDVNEQIVNHVDRFREILSSVPNGQLMIVSLVGPYQTGKSSLIKLLTQDNFIEVGNGVSETTQGAFLYGPYDYNSLRARFEFPPSTNMKIFFIDTEGICGYRVGNNPTLNQVLLTQILAPYVALSQINIVMHNSQIEVGTARFLNNFFDVVNQLIDGDSITILDVIPNQSFRFPEAPTQEEKYQQASQLLKSIIPSRINNVQVSKFIPTSNYDRDASPLEQSPLFYERFNFAARDILESMDNAQKAHYYDSQGIMEQFDYLLENMNKYDFQTLVKQARMQAELNSAERIYSPMVMQLIEIKTDEIKRLFPNISEKEFINEDDLKIETNYSLEPILNRAFEELEQYEMTPMIRENCLRKFRSMIETSLNESFNTLKGQYLRDMINKQTDFILTKIKNKAENEFHQAQIKLNQNTKSRKDVGAIEKFNNNVNKFLDDILKKYSKKFKLSDSVIDNIHSNMIEIMKPYNEMLQNVADDVMKANLQREEIERQERELKLQLVKDTAVGLAAGAGKVLQAGLDNLDKVEGLAGKYIDYKTIMVGKPAKLKLKSDSNTTTETQDSTSTKKVEISTLDHDTQPEKNLDSQPLKIDKINIQSNENDKKDDQQQSIHIIPETKPISESHVEPPKPSYNPQPSERITQGKRVDLHGAKIYASSTSDKPARNQFSGTKYVQDGKVVNGRIRITSEENIGKPAGRTTFGWIDASYI